MLQKISSNKSKVSNKVYYTNKRLKNNISHFILVFRHLKLLRNKDIYIL